MIDEQFVLTVERLRDDLRSLKDELRRKYSEPTRQVISAVLKREAAKLSEIWIVNVARRSEVGQVVPSDYLADLNVHFQRLLNFSERASVRSRHDTEINSILRDFTANVVIPLKIRPTQPPQVGPPPSPIPVRIDDA